MKRLSQDALSLARDRLLTEIAGEITLSSSPGQTLRKWRTLFDLKQRDLARKMGISPSVLSDYEKGKRKTPGTMFVKRFVESLIELDEERGGYHINRYTTTFGRVHSSILDIREFRVPITIGELASLIEAEFIENSHLSSNETYGYSIMDSHSAIKYMDSTDFIYVYGNNSMRTLIFTNVSTGRSPMVAVKIFPLKPSAVVLSGPQDVKSIDWLARELAVFMKVPLLLSHLKSVDEMISRLRRIGQ
ncbi:MAG: helix-turn-helix domain-containing protein [Aigarchaeota archaeon]|nr:helix-turn-helix domain-containing protein [Aigarchaeota archaeon]MDW8092258.1 helix-turn-helix domain-containing protein [Nitrososphaerota archaeon]